MESDDLLNLSDDFDEIYSAIISDPDYINQVDSNGFNLLHSAVLNENLDLLSLLTGHKARNRILTESVKPLDINSTNKYKQTVLHIATSTAEPLKTIKFLCNLGADPQLKDINGNEAFKDSRREDVRNFLRNRRKGLEPIDEVEEEEYKESITPRAMNPISGKPISSQRDRNNNDRT